MRSVNYRELPESFFESGKADDMPIARRMISDAGNIISDVRIIISGVKKKGDDAVRFYSGKFDGCREKNLEVSSQEISRALNRIDASALQSLKAAAKRIEAFAQRQFSCIGAFSLGAEEGIVIGQKIIPLETVGCYVPGGRFALASSALMSVIPAKAAGVKEVIVCSPNIKDEVIAAATIAGASRIFRVGGAQAIAAMAYGTESIPRVDKIVGPGNIYVTAAKKEVFGDVGIDFLAGPSEVMIIADESADHGLIAADLLAQAEHDTFAQANLVTPSKRLASQVIREAERQLCLLPENSICREVMKKSFCIIVRSLKEAVDAANRKAPEHLEVMARNPERLASLLKNYGSLFIGSYSAEVFGDYCSGTNHILPTGGTARFRGGLSVLDFVKVATFNKISRNGARTLIPLAAKLAEIEGLQAHKKAALAREE